MCTSQPHINIPEMIWKKREKQALTKEEIHYFVRGVTEGSIQDSQIGAMLMAIRLQGMTREEAVNLTQEMKVSGAILQWPKEWSGLVVDKHSTGGVGDKVSLILAPALAACGCKVPMISGRGLGHTGGTLDKLESIPGFNIKKNPEEMKTILSEVGCCIVGQTAELVPADKKLYAIRDVTSTVDSLPLIAASIISKKAVESLNGLILDVKFGEGALFKEINGARELAHYLVDIGNRLGIQTLAALSRMDNPIGRCVGNSLEVLESIECLKGNGPKDLEELVTCLGGHLLHLCGKAESVKVGEKAIKDVLKNCSALDKFQAMLVAQGVTAGLAKDLCQGKEVLKRAEKQEELKAEAEGVVQAIHSLPLAKVVHELGAGRNHPEESINWSVGIELLKTVGNKINKGDSWIRVHFEDNSLSEGQKISLQKSLVVGEKVEDVPLVTEIIGAQGQKKHKCAV
ncbi:thymidine phosphorylase isoform X1 [Chiloscyllium plagiosum]|uniref:thymidine phosphorylase isoform X1 n=2 Tax=Chiloscyllium plagiosum TaxID=36176 RepID=UPI001CB80249|nr:thymidine phosphorylase isoform X1 [Chiloscyllium plagiosum]XP_043569850.1 thymidine phosphorylase isoform X1 [Chiloscyllium plagiosum]XP_043569851.1 thymidine phosphorylase isoform X1 [Chiloscyllium plagiosum]XP_043569852.1 thymidine phosphorylase isoform X1 [Chiloscyllium plagiosum]XP_043569853.1 thymidine phosphorylase isoform X1 [Chiloscyllium plagiosum]XP_043569854.1 thymidine phosphorylase isoform X1 [Chiloscyllium plagiosum]XP_043569858.1 thymidine phosphorylase isoform X1 [Chiloscy